MNEGARMRLMARGGPLLVIALWGSATLLSVYALEEIGPLAVSFWRWAWALPALWAALLVSPHRTRALPALRAHFPHIVGVGFSGVTLLYVGQNMALQRTTAFNVGLFIELTPVFIALLALAFLREHPSWRTWAGIGLGFAGAILITLNGFASDAALGQSSLSGDAWALAAALAGAIYTVYGKALLRKMAPVMMLTLSATAGALMLLPLALWEGAFWPQSPAVWGYLIALGLGASAFGNLWWFWELEHRQAAKLGVILFLAALAAAGLAVAVLGDPLTPWLILGGALILIGAHLVK